MSDAVRPKTAWQLAREIIGADQQARRARDEAKLFVWLETRERLVDERYIRLRQELPWTAQRAA